MQIFNNSAQSEMKKRMIFNYLEQLRPKIEEEKANLFLAKGPRQKSEQICECVETSARRTPAVVTNFIGRGVSFCMPQEREMCTAGEWRLVLLHSVISACILLGAGGPSSTPVHTWLILISCNNLYKGKCCLVS